MTDQPAAPSIVQVELTEDEKRMLTDYRTGLHSTVGAIVAARVVTAWEQAHEAFCPRGPVCSTHCRPGDRHLLAPSQPCGEETAMADQPMTDHVRLGPEGNEAAQAVLNLMDGRIHRESHAVYEWPEDEAELHRRPGWRSFDERTDAVSRLRAEKIVSAVVAAYGVSSAVPDEVARDE